MARAREHLRALEVKHSELLSQLSGLKLERRSLLLRQAVLGSWLGALSMMQLHLAVDQLPDLYDDAAAEEPDLQTVDLLQTDLLLRQQLATQQHDLPGSTAAQQAMTALYQRPKGWRGKAPLLQSLLQDEVGLLRKLNITDSQEGSHQPTLEQLLQPDDSTIAPWSNPMAYLHSYLDRPLLEEAATLSGADAADNMSSMVQKLGIQLHRLSTVPPWEQPAILAEIKQSWDRHLHCMTSLVLLGRQDVVEALHCINLETMAHEPAAAAAHQQEQAPALAAMLGLSDQAAELIAVGTRLYYDLLASVHQERQQINGRMTALQQEQDLHSSNGNTSSGGGGDRGGPSSSAGSGAEAGSPASGNSSERLETLHRRQELLEKQQELTDRLNLLLHKEYKLRMAAMSWFIGCLSFEQFSKLAVCSWPYAVRTLFVATHIMEQREKLLKQRTALRG